MLSRFLTKLTVYMLRNKKLTGEQKSLVLSELLKNMHTVPTRDIIKYDSVGTLLINGRPLDIEQAQVFLESCYALKNNPARKIINEQLTFEAIKLGIHSGLNSEMILFSKAILWQIEQENKLLADMSNE